MSACRHCGADMGDTSRLCCDSTCRAADEAERAEAKRHQDLEAALRTVARHDGEATARAIVDRVLPRRGRGRPKGDSSGMERVAKEFVQNPTANQEALAIIAKVAPPEVSKWLRDPRFWHKAAEISQYEEDRQKAEKEDAERDLREKIESVARERLPQWIVDRWTGPMHIEHCGRFADAACYISFLLAAGKLPVELWAEVRQELDTADLIDDPWPPGWEHKARSKPKTGS